MKVAIVRGKYLNQFEMQSYESLAAKHQLVGFGSLRPLHGQFQFPIVKLASPMDLPDFHFKMPILNRLIVDAQYLWGLEKKLTGFDIAHTAETYYYFTQQCLNAKKANLVKRVVSTVWEIIPFNNEGIRGRTGFKKRALEKIDHFLAVTEMAKKTLMKEGGNPNKITVIPMGVDLKKFKIKKVSAIDKKINILFVGRLEEEKGIFELLEAFRQLIKIYPNLGLTVIGDGSQKKKLTSLIDQNRLNLAVQLIKVPYENMPEFYQSADIFCFPSKPAKYWQEQFGMALVEAMASGLPIISTTSGAIPEVVGEAGILVKPNNSSDLHRVLKMLVQKREMREKLKKLSRQRAEKLFDSDKVALKIEGLWKKVMNK